MEVRVMAELELRLHRGIRIIGAIAVAGVSSRYDKGEKS
jgi:hypothetical protein